MEHQLQPRKGPGRPTKASQVRTKTYSINKEKAMAKKRDACDKLNLFDLRGGNYYLDLNTATFEAFKKAIFNNLHMPGMGKSRHIQLIEDIDTDGIHTQDIVKITNWQALTTNLRGDKSGPCFIVINLYRTKSSVMVNGKNAHEIAPTLENLVHSIGTNPVTREVNKAIKDTLSNRGPSLTAAKAIPDSSVNAPSAPEEEVSMATPPREDRMLPHIPNTNNTTNADLLSLQGTRAASTDGLSDEAQGAETCELCATCSKEVVSDEAHCDTCDHTYHHKCEQLTKKEKKELKRGKEYKCKSCRILLEEADGTIHEQGNMGSAAVGGSGHTNSTPGAPPPTPSSGYQQAHTAMVPTTTCNLFPAAAGMAITQCTSATTAPLLATGPQHPLLPPPPTSSLAMAMPTLPTSLLPVSMQTPPIYTHGMPIVAPSMPLTQLALQQPPAAHPYLRPPPVLPPAENDYTRILLQLDKTTNDYNHLHIELEAVKASNHQLQHGLDKQKNELEANKKKWAAREKQIKTREAALTGREANQDERDEQIELLKAHANHLERKVIDLEKQNKDLKLKLLTSEELRNEPGQNLCTPHSASHSADQMGSISSLLQTSILAATVNLLSNMQQPQQQQPAQRITNIFQPYNEAHSKYHPKQHRRQPPYIFEYDHGKDGRHGHMPPKGASKLQENGAKESATQQQQPQPPPKGPPVEGQGDMAASAVHPPAEPAMQQTPGTDRPPVQPLGTSSTPKPTVLITAPMKAPPPQQDLSVESTSAKQPNPSGEHQGTQLQAATPHHHFLGVGPLPKDPGKTCSQSQPTM